MTEESARYQDTQNSNNALLLWKFWPIERLTGMGVLVTESGLIFPSPGKEEILKLTLLSIRQHAARLLFQPKSNLDMLQKVKGIAERNIKFLR